MRKLSCTVRARIETLVETNSLAPTLDASDEKTALGEVSRAEVEVTQVAVPADSRHATDAITVRLDGMDRLYSERFAAQEVARDLAAELLRVQILALKETVEDLRSRADNERGRVRGLSVGWAALLAIVAAAGTVAAIVQAVAR